MKTNVKRLLAVLLTLSMIIGMAVTTFAAKDSTDDGKVTTLIVCTDRHEFYSEFDNAYAAKTNNLEAVLEGIKSTGVVEPEAILISGDNVGRSGRNPVGDSPYYLSDIQKEVDNVYGGSVKAYYTYGSHDKHTLAEDAVPVEVKKDKDGNDTNEVQYYTGDFSYDGFLTGPQEMDGYYLYGISFTQMGCATDQQADEERENTLKGNNGWMGDFVLELDYNDPNGKSAETASAKFLSWIDSLDNNWPVVVGCHMPAHQLRNDNLGGGIWAKAFNEASKKHDIIFIWGHNHTLEEQFYKGNTNMGTLGDQDYYLQTPGDTIPFLTGEKIPVLDENGEPKLDGRGNPQYEYPGEEVEIKFTYLNAGYLKLGYATTISFEDKEGDGVYDELVLRRFSVHLGAYKDQDNNTVLDEDGNPLDIIDYGKTEYTTPYKADLEFATDSEESFTEITVKVESDTNDGGCRKYNDELYFGYTVTDSDGNEVVLYSKGTDGIAYGKDALIAKAGERYTFKVNDRYIVVDGASPEVWNAMKAAEEARAEAEAAKAEAEAAKAEAEAAKGDAAAAREAQAKAEAAQKAAEEAQKIAEEKLAALEAAQKPSDEPQNVPAGMFPDVMDASKSYYKPVYWAVGRGIVQGYKDGNFGPADSCTRAQFVTMLWRFAGRPASSAAVSFTDVDSSMSSYRAIQWAVGEGIIQGYKDNTFKPQGTTTRRQVAVMLWRMQGKPSASQAAPFTDVETSDSAYRAIQWGAEAGVVKGSKAADGTTQFKPDDLCQRQQIVTFLYRFARDVMGEDVNK